MRNPDLRKALGIHLVSKFAFCSSLEFIWIIFETLWTKASYHLPNSSKILHCVKPCYLCAFTACTALSSCSSKKKHWICCLLWGVFKICSGQLCKWSFQNRTLSLFNDLSVETIVNWLWFFYFNVFQNLPVGQRVFYWNYFLYHSAIEKSNQY